MYARAASLFSELLQNSPLRHPGFRMFYFGSVGVALGYTMQATVAAWLMATLTPSALMVALVQTASNLPFLLFGLAAGALADIFDRRRIVLITQLVLVSATVVLGLVTLSGHITPAALLALTFVIGSGFAFYMPAQQASINDLVGRAELPRAVALGAVAFNVARAAGPALAGAIAAWLSTGSALLMSAPGFVVMIAAVRRWKRAAGHARHSGDAVLRHPGRAALHAALAAAARAGRAQHELRHLRERAVGAAAGDRPRPARPGRRRLRAAVGGLRRRRGHGRAVDPAPAKLRSLNRVVNLGFILSAASMVLIATSDYTVLALAGAFGAGAAWVSVFASLSAATQSAAPAWVRARAVAMSMVGVMASIAFGSMIWGAVASAWARASRWRPRPGSCWCC